MRGLLIEVASLVAEHGLWSFDWVVGVHRLICPVSCGIFTDQGLDPCALRWQMDSYPLDHQGSPRNDLVLLKSCTLGGQVKHSESPEMWTDRNNQAELGC